MEISLEDIKRIKAEDEMRFNALYADEYGKVEEEYYEEELRSGKRYHLHWDGCKSVVYSSFKDVKETFYSEKKDGVVFKMDGFQAGQLLFQRKNGKVWTIFD